MLSHRLNNMAICIEKEGSVGFAKQSSPIRFGRYSEIKTYDYEFRFNLNAEIKFIRGLNVDWPHPSEVLKRTDGNDWVYYTVGDTDNKIKDWFGEYYLPCLPYPSNSIWDVNPFANSVIMTAFAAWSQLYANIYQMLLGRVPSTMKKFLTRVMENHDNALFDKSEELRKITGGRISVLPPDARHVDYEVIPVMVADGCLYHCDFCEVKSKMRFKPRPHDDIEEQIRRLKSLYGRNGENYRALFLGNHDGLGAGPETILQAAKRVIKEFGFDQPHMKSPFIFMFGSVDSLLKSEEGLLNELNSLPVKTFINVGFESVDESTIKSINKPLKITKIKNAFEKMLRVNRDYKNLEITGNFLLGEQFSRNHYDSLVDLLSSVPGPVSGKGAVYLSPLMGSENKNELLKRFYEIKEESRLPAYIYLIQRL